VLAAASKAATEICQFVIAEFEETIVTTAAAVDAEYVGPGDEKNSNLGAAAESNDVAGYHLA
jgi:hypothetical protein